MPSRNTVRQYQPYSYYHVYNCGVNGRSIFKDQQDYSVFLNLLKRHLDIEPSKDKSNRELVWLYEQIELLTYCLMPNHFHLLLYQVDKDAIAKLLKAVGAAYTGYFNKKHHRYGALFQGTYKASAILNDSYLMHISRYIHLNPDNYKDYEYSSLPYYLGSKSAAWVRPEKITDMFDKNPDVYLMFLEEYENRRGELEDIKHMLADC